MIDEDISINVLALAKGTEWYIWLYRDADVREVVNEIGRFAADVDLSLSWYDAAVLCTRLRNLHPTW